MGTLVTAKYDQNGDTIFDPTFNTQAVRFSVDGSKIYGANGESVISIYGKPEIPAFTPPNIWVRRPYIRSITEFGAIGDNTERKLSTFFATLAQAQAVYPSATSLDDLIDWAAFQTAIDTIRLTGNPGYLECGEEAQYRFKKPVVFNPTFDCNTLVQGISIIGPAGHRAYDSGTEYPVTITVSARDGETSEGAFDMRAAQMCKIEGLGLYGFTQGTGVINQLVRIGAEGCANPASIVRVATVSKNLFYGGSKSINAYLTSGLIVSNNNICRALVNGVEMNACGDATIDGNLFNNIGPMLNADIPVNASSGLGTSYHDGSALALYGGGGNNFVTENRFEVCNKGITAFNMQGLRIQGGFVDKCREFGIGIATSANVSGSTNLAYQPRSIQIEGVRFISNGWNSTYNSHLFLENTGTGNNFKVNLTGNVFAYAGPNAIDLLPDVYVSQQKIFGVGPFRTIRVNNSGGGTMEVLSAGNQYSGGATDYTVDAATSTGVVFDSSSDSFDKPVTIASGEIRGAKKTVTVSISWTPGSIASAAGISYGAISLPNATIDTVLTVTPPSSLANLIAQPYVTGAGTGNLRLFNGTGGAITGSSGTWKISYQIDKWL